MERFCNRAARRNRGEDSGVIFRARCTGRIGSRHRLRGAFSPADRDRFANDTGIVFVGYGIVAPEFGWDDLKSADLAGKTAVVLDGEPVDASISDFFQGEVRTYYSTVASKFETLRRRGAVAVLVLYNSSNATTSLAALKNSYALESFALKAVTTEPPPALVEGRLTQAAFARLCTASDENLESIKAAAEAKTFSPVSLKAAASFEVVTTLREVTSHNVVAKISGRDSAARSEVIIYTAHWDHLGKNTALSGDTIFNGAIDNAAGVAQLLGVAGAFAKAPQAPKRTVLFVFTTAEEKGYLGARHYVREPLFPLSRTVAAINLDSGNVWGRTLDVINLGFGLTTLDESLERAAVGQGRRFVSEPFAAGSYFFASDQIEFAKAGVPAIFPSPGSDFRDRPAGYGDQKWGEYGEKDYHQVTDSVRADWDYSGLVEDAQWLWAVGDQLAESDEAPQWRSGAGFHRAK